MSSDVPPTLIVDIGSGFIKAGLQTDTSPPCIFPTLVGRPRRRFVDQFKGSPFFVADDAICSRHSLSFSYPVDHGHVEDWLDLEHLFQYLFSQGLGLDSTQDRSVLLTEPPMASSKHRETLVELMMDLFGMSEVNLSIQGIMALYAYGRTTGLVIEIGEGVTQIVPVHDGFTDRASIRRLDLGGQELTMYLQKLLSEAGYCVTSRDDYEHVRSIKETLCYVAVDPYEEDKRTDNDAEYVLPDGMTLRDGTTSVIVGSERFYCPEVLFDPRIIQRDCPSIIDLVWQSIQASPIETRKSALGSVILSGGSSLFPGLPERVEKEIKRISPPQARSTVRVHASDDRLFGVWLGARLFAEPAMRPMQSLYWISRQEWEEEGERVVARKTLLRAS